MNKHRQNTNVPALLGRRQFLVASGFGVAGLMLFPFDSVSASPVFSAVAKFAQSIGASAVATTINDYVGQDELDKKTVSEIKHVNAAIGRKGFSDLSQGSVYVPATEGTYFFYPARHTDQFNAIVHFFDTSHKRGPRLICSLDGPTLFGVAELASSVAQKNSKEVAKQTLLPRQKVRIGSGRLDKMYSRPNVYKTDVGTVTVSYRTDGKGKGLVGIEARDKRGTLLAGGDYELAYRIDEPRRHPA